MSTFLTMLLVSIARGSDITGIITNDAINNKIIAAVEPVLNEFVLNYVFPADSSEGDSYLVNYTKITVQTFSYDSISTEFFPINQTITISMLNFSLYSNWFDFTVRNQKYKLLTCSGSTQLVVNKWDLTFTIYFEHVGDQIINDTNYINITTFDISDCQIQVYVDKESVKMNTHNELGFNYTFYDHCEHLNGETVSDAFKRLVIDNYIDNTFPNDLEDALQKGMIAAENEHQQMILQADYLETDFLVCYQYIIITNDYGLQVTALLIFNHSNFNIKPIVIDIPPALKYIEDIGGEALWISIIVVSNIFFLLGCYDVICCMKNSCCDKSVKHDDQNVIQTFDVKSVEMSLVSK